MTILLLANGDVEQPDWLTPMIEQAAAIIAVDGGARHLAPFDRIPDVLVGDLDSLDQGIVTDFSARGCKLLRFPEEKDETDLELALIYAAAQPQWRAWPITIAAVLGGRLDQTLANLFLLAHPALSGRDVRIIAPHQFVWLVDDHTVVEGKIGDIVSLVPVGGPVIIDATTGLKWPLLHETLNFGPARGISNRLTHSTATISVTSGQLLCIHIEGAWGR